MSQHSCVKVIHLAKSLYLKLLIVHNSAHCRACTHGTYQSGYLHINIYVILFPFKSFFLSWSRIGLYCNVLSDQRVMAVWIFDFDGGKVTGVACHQEKSTSAQENMTTEEYLTVIYPNIYWAQQRPHHLLIKMSGFKFDLIDSDLWARWPYSKASSQLKYHRWHFIRLKFNKKEDTSHG